MLTTLRPAIALFVLAGVVAAAEPAYASGVDSNCADSSCTFTYTVDGSGGDQASSNGGPDAGSNQSGTTTPSPSPTRTLDAACTYQTDPSYQPPAGSDPTPSGPGAYYLRSCPNALTSSGNGFTYDTSIVWLTNPPAATAPDPATLAARAEGELNLTPPPIATSPRTGLASFPGVNVWAWIPASSWTSRSATATAAGESVTATAAPSYSTWDFGDGTVVSCQGPGTVYQGSDGANPASPTCGHAYSQPGSYTETVTVHWLVTWKGGGQAGAFNQLTTTTRVPVTVGESEAVVTR